MRHTLTFLLICLSAQLLPAQQVEQSEFEIVVPSESLPDRLEIQPANNNLDVIRFRDRYYFAFRTAPTHFASSKTVLYMVSSPDLKSWQFETEFKVAADMREPRFLVMGDQLYFYFFEAGDRPLKFEPHHVWACSLDKNGNWTEKKKVDDLDGFVPWRFRVRRDTAYMSAYYGKELYLSTGEGNLRLFRSTDGMNWEPLSKEPQVTLPSAEEGEFIFDEEGNLWGIVRLEGNGGATVFAESSDLATWETQFTGFKYDSSFLFEWEGEIYLVARRSLDGTMNKAPKWLSWGIQKAYNLARYSMTRKRTAIWRLDKQNRKWIHLADLPGTGDTAFPAVVEDPAGELVVFNYTTDFRKKDVNWILGQLGPTFIYKLKIRIKN